MAAATEASTRSSKCPHLECGRSRSKCERAASAVASVIDHPALADGLAHLEPVAFGIGDSKPLAPP